MAADPSRDARILRLTWLAFGASVAVSLAATASLVIGGVTGTAAGGARDALFYLNAALNIGAIAGAFALQRRLERRLPRAGGYRPAVATARTHALLSLAAMAASALVACALALLTGELANVLFALPFFAFAALFWPSDGRFAFWLAIAGVGR